MSSGSEWSPGLEIAIASVCEGFEWIKVRKSKSAGAEGVEASVIGEALFENFLDALRLGLDRSLR